MPRTKSAKKAFRQSTSRREHNLEKDKVLKSVIKQYKKAAESGNTSEAAEMLPKVYKTLDKAAKTNLIKKNKASRLKGRLAKTLNKKAA